ncbi:MAG: ABC transporter permease [Chloroflexi bacterium]|nr:ABC transporter permease [Chloroflexota bacterium]
MARYALQRILLALPLLFGLSLLVFFYVRIIPGDPVTAMLGVQANPDLVARLRAQYGFDEPILDQYLMWLGNVLQGDFGISFRSRQAVAPIIVDRIPATLQLMLGGLFVSLVVAIPFGIRAGMKYRQRSDTVISTITLVGLGSPGFWLGTILMVIFALVLKWLPSQGYTPFTQDPVASIRYMILPSVAIGLVGAPFLVRVVRSTVVEIMKEPFVPYADARGLREQVIFWRYIIRNLLPQFVVVLGVLVGALLAGSVAIEALFNWPGMGRIFIGAVTERDYAMIQALILVYGVIFVVINLIAEIAQAALDPRIRLK